MNETKTTDNCVLIQRRVLLHVGNDRTLRRAAPPPLFSHSLQPCLHNDAGENRGVCPDGRGCAGEEGQDLSAHVFTSVY